MPTTNTAHEAWGSIRREADRDLAMALDWWKELGKDGKIGVKRCEIWFLPFLTVSYCFLQVQRTRTVRGARVKVMS